MIESAHILIVDDNPKNLQLLANILTETGYRIGATLNGKDAINSAIQNLPDLILLDVMMPVLDGFEVCKILKENPLTASIPIIFLTAKDQTEDKITGFSLGAVDYLTKPINPPELLVRVKTHLQLKELHTNLEKLVAQRTEELVATNAELEAANKSKDQFLKNMSHELKTPLNHIFGMSELLSFEDTLTDQQLEYIDIIKDSSLHLLSIFNALLSFSDIKNENLVTLEKKPFSLKLVYKELWHLFFAQKKRNGLNVNLNIRLTPDLPDMVVGDRYRYEMVLFNLIDNAVKYSEEGTITVATKLLEETETQYVMETTIHDEGIGFTMSASEKIFEQFFKCDMSSTQKYGGIGLGLSLAKSTIELMGGTIRAESEGLDRGSTFLLTYQLYKSA